MLQTQGFTGKKCNLNFIVNVEINHLYLLKKEHMRFAGKRVRDGEAVMWDGGEPLTRTHVWHFLSTPVFLEWECLTC